MKITGKIHVIFLGVKKNIPDGSVTNIIEVNSNGKYLLWIVSQKHRSEGGSGCSLSQKLTWQISKYFTRFGAINAAGLKGARTVAEMWPCESSEEAISEYMWPQIHGNPRIKGVIERSCGLVLYVKFRIPELARSLCSGRYSVRFSGNPKVWKWH